MSHKLFTGLLIFIFTLILYACNRDPSVRFEEINDEDIARFTLYNPTDKDIDSFRVELTYLSEKGEPLKTDSVKYRSNYLNGSLAPFIRAGEETFIVQKVPPGTTSAKGRFLDVWYDN